MSTKTKSSEKSKSRTLAGFFGLHRKSKRGESGDKGKNNYAQKDTKTDSQHKRQKDKVDKSVKVDGGDKSVTAEQNKSVTVEEKCNINKSTRDKQNASSTQTLEQTSGNKASVSVPAIKLINNNSKTVVLNHAFNKKLNGTCKPDISLLDITTSDNQHVNSTESSTIPTLTFLERRNDLTTHSKELQASVNIPSRKLPPQALIDEGLPIQQITPKHAPTIQQSSKLNVESDSETDSETDFSNCNGKHNTSDKLPNEKLSNHFLGSSIVTTRRRANNINNNKDFNLNMFDVTITLGTGTFGRVFLAEPREGDGVYAMKIMKIKDIIKLNQVEHVNSEKYILEITDHPFIVKCYWTFRDHRCLYMLFEYVPGGELFTYLRNKERFPPQYALFYICEIICALEYLHKQQIVYRDLKPENLLLDVDGHLKFTDFGFSKVLEDITYTLCGTPEYLSPEAIQGKGHDCTCDWWSLGILTYEMLVGEAPFLDDHPFGLYQKILTCRISWPAYLNNTDQRDFINKLVVLDRSQRMGKGQNGTEDVKNHSWFKGVNWNDVYSRKLKPPIRPRIAFAGDTSNFDDFDDDWDLLHTPDVTQKEFDKFEDWESDT